MQFIEYFSYEILELVKVAIELTSDKKEGLKKGGNVVVTYEILGIIPV